MSPGPIWGILPWLHRFSAVAPHRMPGRWLVRLGGAAPEDAAGAANIDRPLHLWLGVLLLGLTAATGCGAGYAFRAFGLELRWALVLGVVIGVLSLALARALLWVVATTTRFRSRAAALAFGTVLALVFTTPFALLVAVHMSETQIDAMLAAPGIAHADAMYTTAIADLEKRKIELTASVNDRRVPDVTLDPEVKRLQRAYDDKHREFEKVQQDRANELGGKYIGPPGLGEVYVELTGRADSVGKEQLGLKAELDGAIAKVKNDRVLQQEADRRDLAGVSGTLTGLHRDRFDAEQTARDAAAHTGVGPRLGRVVDLAERSTLPVVVFLVVLIFGAAAQLTPIGIKLYAGPTDTERRRRQDAAYPEVALELAKKSDEITRLSIEVTGLKQELSAMRAQPDGTPGA